MTTPPPSSPPLVWVTQGKNQHAAFLLKSADEEEKCLVRWSSTGETDLVKKSQVVNQLTPRRLGQASPCYTDSPSRQEKISHESSGEKRKKSPSVAAVNAGQDEEGESEDDEVQVLLTILPPTPKRPKQNEKADRKRVSTESVASLQHPESDVGVQEPAANGNDQQAVSDFAEKGDVPGQVRRRVADDDMEESGVNCKELPIPTETQVDRGNDPITKRTDEMDGTDTRASEAHVATVAGQDPASSGTHEETTTVLDITTGVAHRDALSNQQSAEDKARSTSDSVKPLYTFQSSAYVQNLAEICFTILHDRRWRVGQERKRLLAWERGDDLSAVHLLAKLYEPPKRRRRIKCSCLLCQDSADTKDSMAINDRNTEVEDDEDDGKLSADDSKSQTDEELARAVHLYCRLYYRKGPWFRLDDIFSRYYAPKKIAATSEHEEQSVVESTEHDGDSVKERRKSFFKRQSSSGGAKSTSNIDQVIDQASLEGHFAALTLLIRDVERLHSIGLVRSFHSEEECGKTSGAVTPEGSGVLLLADERRAIVTKLGGVKDKNRRKSNEKTRRRSISPQENAVWKQMRQQKSISLVTSQKKSALLPVCRHVNDVLLEKLATCIVLASSTVDYVPAAILRSAVSSATSRIRGMLKSLSAPLVTMCLTLRDAPLLALRRCARLYLCATSGPGDMRGDGTNAWRSLQPFDAAAVDPDVPIPHLISPPGAHTWHRIVYPALSHRFGIASFAFIDAHEFLPCIDDDKNSKPAAASSRNAYSSNEESNVQLDQVFNSIVSFQLWEACVELRAHVDYHIELHETLMYQARRQARESKSSENEAPQKADSTREKNIEEDKHKYCALTSECPTALDFLDLLTVNGRRNMVHKLVGFIDSQGVVDRVHQEVENQIAKLETFIDDTTAQASKVDGSAHANFFQTDSERIVVVIAVIIRHVLVVRHESIAPHEVHLKKAHPWLRHLYWEGILAYALWDCVPLIERIGLYDLACSCLEVIMFGKRQKHRRDSLEAAAPMGEEELESMPLSGILVSRRTRGKAHERLMIDYVHLLRQKTKKEVAPAENKTATNANTKRKKKQNGAAPQPPQDVVRRICERVIGAVASAGSIPFSAVRALARRLKAPLVASLKADNCPEAHALGIRLGNGTDPTCKERTKAKGYVDWLPPTDHAVANAMACEEEPLVGKRCSYVGFEENESEGADTSSLNVEQLSMQYYATGRLPIADNGNEYLSGGGWTGWHDEGGHVRALFRIICARSILGMNSGCGGETIGPLESMERLSIHLTPYQGAPFDLHVAHWEKGTVDMDSADDQDEASVRSFYARRRMQIDAFLQKLETLDGQSLCDLVYDAIVGQLKHMGEGRVQASLAARDLQHIRTMSLLAAGFGGRQLSSMFRCLLFDYRHYSGGLPDLLLVRARYADKSDAVSEDTQKVGLVDLGEWVGEEFSAEVRMEQEAANRASFLIDKDDEFLGCSKVGDSGGQSTSRWRNRTQRQPSRTDDATGKTTGNELSLDKLPPRLLLRHDEREVEVQCMFVEVKSLNDRLDGRQEDWLNVLDRFGNARVCKFGNGKKKKKSAAAKSSKS